MNSDILDYLRHIRPKIASTTYIRKQWQIREFYRWAIDEKKQIATLNRADVERFLLSLIGTQQYRQATCMVVREFYDVLRVRQPDLSPRENPAAGIKFKPDKSRRLPFHVPNQAAIDTIFDRLYDHDNDLHLRDRLMAELAYGSGLRRDELRKVNVEDINFEENTLMVTGKGNKMRVVPLTEKAIKTVREYLARRKCTRGPLLLSHMGRRLSCNGVYSVMHDRVGIRPHLMRHACATHLLKNGCSIRAIQELLGHERLGTTYLYTAVEKECLREVIGTAHPRALRSM